jgi:hypothetical protein
VTADRIAEIDAPVTASGYESLGFQNPKSAMSSENNK